jgi:hypothetical protein
MKMTRRGFAEAGLGATSLASIGWAIRAQAADVPVQEARTIAKDAYVYGFPPVDSYRILYAYFVDRQNPEYKGAWNEVHNEPRVFTPADAAIQTPNSDTPYSWLGLDLRAEPIVLTVPQIEKDRYFSVQLIDLYTFNFDYIGSRATGNGGGAFLVAGPSWKGETPKGITKVFRCETELMLAVFRTQLFKPDDIENVKKVQAGYKAQPLSQFLGLAASPASAAIDFVKPLTADEQRTSPRFFNLLDFVLQFCPTDPSERDLMARFAKIGVGAGITFDPDKLSPEMKQAIEAGMADAWNEYAAFKKSEVDTGKVKSGDIFGTRSYLKNNYLYRMTAAVLGIWGNSAQEAMYPVYTIGSDGQALNGGHRYVVRLMPDRLPPANAFWSLTMYELPASLLLANPINRYLINSPMLPQLKHDVDGGVTIYVQSDSPGADKESNWLPAPKGPFAAYMRIYWPKPEALDGSWKQPPMQKVS